MRIKYFIVTFFFLATQSFAQNNSESDESASIFYGVLKAGIEGGNLKIFSSEGKQLFSAADKVPRFFVNIECMLRVASILDCGIGIEGGIPRGFGEPNLTVLGGPTDPEFYFVPIYAVARINLSKILPLRNSSPDKYVYFAPRLGYTVFHDFDGFENFKGARNISDLTYFSLGLGLQYHISKGYGAGTEIYFASNRAYMNSTDADFNNSLLMVRYARIGWNLCFAF